MSRPLDVRAPLRDQPEEAFVAATKQYPGKEDTAVVGIRFRLGGMALVSTSRRGSYTTRWRIVPSSRSLERVLSRELGERVRYAAAARKVTWGRGTQRPVLRGFYWLLASFVMFFLAVIFDSTFHFLLFPAAAIWLWLMLRIKHGPIRDSSPTIVDLGAIRTMGRKGSTDGGSLSVGSVEAPGDAVAAVEQVDQVKAEYGQLLSDVVYRIENSALFDPAVEQTREFTLLLARWDERGTLGADSTVELAYEVRLAFDAARANAETLGLKHLPRASRAEARRAVKALHLAEQATTDGERAAAIEQATRILSSLAIYYLPNLEETKEALGDALPELEGDVP